jgi:hypothetical protein
MAVIEETESIKKMLGQYGYEGPSCDGGGGDQTETLGPDADVSNLAGVMKVFRKYVDSLKCGNVHSGIVAIGRQVFIRCDGLLLVFLNAQRTDEDLNDAVKLADLSANAFQRKSDFEDDTVAICLRVLKSITLLRHLHRLGGPSGSSSGVDDKLISFIVDKFCSNFNWQAEVMRQFAKNSHELSLLGSTLEPVLKNISSLRQTAVLKAVFNNASSGQELLETIGRNVPYQCRDVMAKLLLDRRSINPDAYLNLICCLSHCLKQGELLQLLLKCLDLWSDKVIARAHVSYEIVHYTKISFIVFYHILPETLAGKAQMGVVERLVKGLPNHFNSTDPRTVNLAKFFSQLITDTMKHYQDKEEQIDEEVKNPEEELCRQVLDAFHLCGKTDHFWYRPPAPVQQMEDLKLETKPEQSTLDFNSDDDDSDLEPIDTLDAPSENNIKFLRHFLEQFPEIEKFEETRSALSALPGVIRHQLALEHPEIGKEILESVFLWENQFEAAELDDIRKGCLGTVLKTHLEGNLQHFLQFFHRDQMQPWRKNLVLDVVVNVAKEASLKDLQTIARATFRQLLLDDRSLNDQDTIVKIPFVLCLGRILCLLPGVMLEEEMVVKYLSALSNLRHVDGATEQTVKYSLNNVMSAIGHLHLSGAVQNGIRDTREWLLAIENSR